MENLKYFDRFYIDREKDIVVELYKADNMDEIKYIIRTPNHKSGNLITNLAKICNLETIRDENNLKIIKNTTPASINGGNEEVYIFRLAGMKIANIYSNRIEVKAKMPAIPSDIKTSGDKFAFICVCTSVLNFDFLKIYDFTIDFLISKLYCFV